MKNRVGYLAAAQATIVLLLLTTPLPLMLSSSGAGSGTMVPKLTGAESSPLGASRSPLAEVGTVSHHWQGLSPSVREILKGAPPAVSHSTALALPPASATPALPSASTGYIATKWPGISFSNNSCGCVPPDGAVAEGSGQVVEMVNSALTVWNTAGTPVANESMAKFFGIPSANFFSDPYIIFDANSGRWFASGININGATYAGEVVVNVSKTSNFLGGWYQYNFSSSPTNLTDQPFISVTSDNLLVSANIFDSVSGALYGAMVWVANLTAVTSGTLSPAQEFTWGPNVLFGSLHPVRPVGQLGTSYFVSDNFGANYGVTSQTFLNVLQMTGSPPGAVTTQDFNLTIKPEAPAPNSWCAYDGTGACLDLDDGRILSAVWHNGYIWATANEGCLVGAVTNACIRLFELNVSGTTPAILQQIDYNEGAASMDDYGSVGMDYMGDLVMDYTNSSNTTFPGLMMVAASAAQIQSANANHTALTLQAPTTVAAGVGYLDPSLVGFNRWGDYFEISADPSNWNSLWMEGEYIGPNNATDYYATYVAKASFPASLYPVNITETGLASNISWTASLNGLGNAASTPWINFNVPNGTYALSITGEISVAPGVRYLANVTTGTLSVAGKATHFSVHFTQQDYITTAVWPSSAAGSVQPSSGWLDTGNHTQIVALPSAGYQFLLWQGSGTGNYTGTNSTIHLTVANPITEKAYFGALPQYSVTLSESGLPAGTSWQVTFDGHTVTTTNSSVVFQRPNGSYAYAVPGVVNGSASGVRFSNALTAGTLGVSGKAASLLFPFKEQYSLSVVIQPAAAGTVAPTAGWYLAGTALTLHAYGASGYVFSKWNGTGVGSYSGTLANATVTLNGPVNETAVFQRAPSTSSTGSGNGIPLSLFIVALIVGIVAAATVGFLVGRKRKGRGPSAGEAPPTAPQGNPPPQAWGGAQGPPQEWGGAYPPGAEQMPPPSQ